MISLPTFRLLSLVLVGLALALPSSYAFLTQGKLPPFEGAEDTNFFGTNGRDPADADHGFDNVVRTIVYHANTNSLIVAGDFTKYNGIFVSGIAKLSLNGELDTAFNANIGAGFTGAVYALAIDSNHKIIVGGTFTNAGGYSNLDYIARLLPTGAYDPSFMPDAIAGEIKSIAIDSTDRMVIGCNCHDDVIPPYNYQQLARLRASDGKFDNTFNQTVLTYDGSATVNGVGILADGSIVATGSFVVSGIYNVMKFQPTGAVDATFYANVGTGTNNPSFGFSVKIQPDNKILIGGSFTTFNGTSAPKLVRLNSNGTTDTGFGLTSNGGSIYDILIDPLNRLFVVGTQFGNVGGSNIGYRQIRRYGTTGGGTDVTFNTGDGFGPLATHRAYSLAYHKGYVYVVGDFEDYNGKMVPRIAKIYAGPYNP